MGCGLFPTSFPPWQGGEAHVLHAAPPSSRFVHGMDFGGLISIYQPTDRRTDGRTDGPADQRNWRIVCIRRVVVVTRPSPQWGKMSGKVALCWVDANEEGESNFPPWLTSRMPRKGGTFTDIASYCIRGDPALLVWQGERDVISQLLISTKHATLGNKV